MNIASIVHETKSRYSYMYNATTLHVRIKTGKGEVKSIKARGADPFNWIPNEKTGKYEFDTSTYKEKEMAYEGEDKYHDIWFCELDDIDTKRIRYGFIINTTEGEELLYGCNSVEDLKLNPSAKDNSFNFFNFPYLNDEDIYKAPKWSKDMIWYQVTPTCFSDKGREAKDNISGNFWGLIEKMDYIKSLGVNGIYLTPIFEAKSWHLYDTTDYFKVAESLGGDEAFKAFMEKAHSLGMKVMLDAVFNHCGPRHEFWQDVIKNGKNSKYYDCFYVFDDNKPVISTEVDENGDYTEEGGYDVNFRTFAYTSYMPKMNTSHPLMREHLIEVGKYWVEKFGIDAWRLDVSNEVSHDFWKLFRKEIKGINPDVYIMGENWDDSYPWLQGDQFDTVMNYGIMNLIWGLVAPENTQVKKIKPTQYKQGLVELMTKYPNGVTEHMFNLVSSHDVPRLLDICKGDKDKLKLCYLLLMTYCGAPCVFYGDEILMSNPDGESRIPMVWDEAKQDKETLAYMKKLISLRKQNPAFSAMKTNFLTADDSRNIVVFKKSAENNKCYVIINNNETNMEIKLPCELVNKTFTNLFTGETIALDETINIEKLGFLVLQ